VDDSLHLLELDTERGDEDVLVAAGHLDELPGRLEAGEGQVQGHVVLPHLGDVASHAVGHDPDDLTLQGRQRTLQGLRYRVSSDEPLDEEEGDPRVQGDGHGQPLGLRDVVDEGRRRVLEPVEEVPVRRLSHRLQVDLERCAQAAR